MKKNNAFIVFLLVFLTLALVCGLVGCNNDKDDKFFLGTISEADKTASTFRKLLP